MKRNTVAVVLVVAVLLVATAIFVETRQLPRSSNRVECTVTIISTVYASTVSTGQVVYSGTSVTTYTSYTNSSASVGEATTTTSSEFLLGGGILTIRTCTFVS